MKRPPYYHISKTDIWVRISRSKDKSGPTYCVYWSRKPGEAREIKRFRSEEVAKEFADHKLIELTKTAQGAFILYSSRQD